MRTIPQNQPALIAFAARALAGAQSLGTTLTLAQNTAARIALEYYDLVGEPGPGPNTGKQAALNQKRAAVRDAQVARRLTLKDGSKFCSDAVDVLKPHLGRTWNARWQAAGFAQFSISTSRGNPFPALLELRNFFRANPARENVADGITAAVANTLATAIQAAVQDLDAAKSARATASGARDSATRQIRRRLTGLRGELDLFLGDTDPRWLDFGFSRPADGQMPAPMMGLTATPGLPTKVQVQYAASARALDYRVRWKINGSGFEPTEIGLFADLAVTLSGLPSGTTARVFVSARNAAGETQPAEVTVLVP